jgi:hypothetical protein
MSLANELFVVVDMWYRIYWDEILMVRGMVG